MNQLQVLWFTERIYQIIILNFITQKGEIWKAPYLEFLVSHIVYIKKPENKIILSKI